MSGLCLVNDWMVSGESMEIWRCLKGHCDRLSQDISIWDRSILSRSMQENFKIVNVWLEEVKL